MILPFFLRYVLVRCHLFITSLTNHMNFSVESIKLKTFFVVGLEPLKGLTLTSPAKMKRSKRYGKFEMAAALRMQCFFRMMLAKMKVMRKRNRQRFERIASAINVICKFMKYVHKLGLKEREINLTKMKAVRTIQNMYRVWASYRWVRRVKNLRKVNNRESDAAIRIRRSLFQKKLGLSKGTIAKGEKLDNEHGKDKIFIGTT